MTIAVVDYHKGNLKSVERGLAAAGGDVLVTDDAAAIARADAVVLPGVGAFADAAATMEALGQAGVVRERIAAGVPFLGICLGMHLMFEEGVEGAPDEDDESSTHNARGLAVLPGVVGAMPKQDEQGLSYKVPHVGWNTVRFPGERQEGEVDGSSPPVRRHTVGHLLLLHARFHRAVGPVRRRRDRAQRDVPERRPVRRRRVRRAVPSREELGRRSALLRNFVSIVKGA